MKKTVAYLGSVFLSAILGAYVMYLLVNKYPVQVEEIQKVQT